MNSRRCGRSIIGSEIISATMSACVCVCVWQVRTLLKDLIESVSRTGFEVDLLFAITKCLKQSTF